MSFEDDVQRAVAEYRFWHEYDDGRQTKATRAALRKLDKLSADIGVWLGSALGSDESPERQAARKMHAAALEQGY